MKTRNWLTFLGFILFITGFLSLILSMVGINFTFLAFIEAPGRTFGLVVKLIMIFGGIILVYISRSDNTV